MQYTHLLFDVRDSVASITLNRPESLNAFNLEMAKELMSAAMECEENRDVRAVVLSGAGNAFCAGGDLKSFAAQGERLPAYITEVTTYFHAAVSYFTRMRALVIAAVQGSARSRDESGLCLRPGLRERIGPLYRRLHSHRPHPRWIINLLSLPQCRDEARA